METNFFSLSAQENVSRGYLTVRYTGWGGGGGGDVTRFSQGVKSYLRLIVLSSKVSFCIVFGFDNSHEE